MSGDAEVLRGAVPLPGDPDAWRKRLQQLGAPAPGVRPPGPFAPPPPPEEEPPAPAPVRRREKSPERVARARANAGAATRRRLDEQAATRLVSRPRPEPVPVPEPVPDPEPVPEPVVAPVEPAPCEVCGIPVAAAYIEKTGRARHGHHPATEES